MVGIASDAARPTIRSATARSCSRSATCCRLVSRSASRPMGSTRRSPMSAGPQLVVPATNARYALNAANARWGSLYDALYGTDALGDPPPAGPYDPHAAHGVVEWVRSFLDDVVPSADGSHRDVVRFGVHDRPECSSPTLAGGTSSRLRHEHAFVGYRGAPDEPSGAAVREQRIGDRSHGRSADPVGAADRAGVADVMLESAVTAIIDLEDSVATVDGARQGRCLPQLAGPDEGRPHRDPSRRPDARSRAASPRTARTRVSTGRVVTKRGRSLMLVRNVGHLMTTPAVLDGDGHPVPEGIIDAMVSALAAHARPGPPGRGSATRRRVRSTS